MTVKVVRKVDRSLYKLMLKPAEPDAICCICLCAAVVEYLGDDYRFDDGAERFADEMFHAKLYAKTIGAHS